MNTRFRTAMSLLSLIAACTSALPASALDLDTFLRSSLGSGGYQNTATQALIKSNISTRQAQLQQQISAGISSAQLTGPEEAELRMQLDHTSRLQSNYLADGQLSTPEVNNILSELASIGTKLEAYMSSTATTVSTLPGGLTLPPWSRPGGRDFAAQSTVRRTNIDRLQLEVKTAIDTAAGNGRLTPREATRLRTQFDLIGAMEVRFQADGRISYREEAQIVNDLNSLRRDLDRTIRNRRPGPGNGWGYGNDRGWGNGRGYDHDRGRGNGRGYDHDRGWGNGRGYDHDRGWGNGRDYDHDRGWGNGRGYDRGRDRGNGRDYDHDRGWGNGGWNRYGDIDSRQSALRRRIQGGISSGRLSTREANRLLADEQRIADLEARLRISENSLSLQERARLSMELDQLSRSLNRELFDRKVR